MLYLRGVLSLSQSRKNYSHMWKNSRMKPNRIHFTGNLNDLDVVIETLCTNLWKDQTIRVNYNYPIYFDLRKISLH